MMWQQWTWWQMSCEKSFSDEAGIVPYVMWKSVQSTHSIRSKNESIEKEGDKL